MWARRIAIAAAAGLLVVFSNAAGLQGGTTYPKLAVYTSQADQASTATLDSLARYDLLVHLWTIRPEALAKLRARNPRIRVLMELQPQYTQLCDSPKPWWLPDTLWSPTRAMQWACYRNPQWLMRTTSGGLVGPLGGNDYLINWTTSCPRGTYGSTRGLRPAQWYPQMLARVCLSGQYWRPMGWDRFDGTLNGVVFEILADCLGSYGHLELLSRTDPDRDGLAEGVSRACSVGGSTEPLSALMRQENAVFWQILRTQFPQEFVFLINENSDAIGPPWRKQLAGMKLENWDGDTPSSWRSWWYGDVGRGYLWAEASMGRSPGVPDRLRGWDVSIVREAMDPRRTASENGRRIRLALGTALLGDGFFYLDPGNEKSSAWRSEFDRNLGSPLGDCYPIAYGGDTLWVRRFTGGSVRVNPTGRALGGVGAHDAALP